MVICYNKNGIIYKGMIVPSRFQKKTPSRCVNFVSWSRLGYPCGKKGLFFLFFYCFYLFFFFDFRITIYVTNNKGRNESLIIGEQPDIEGNQRISEKKEEVAELKCLSRVRFFFPS